MTLFPKKNRFPWGGVGWEIGLMGPLSFCTGMIVVNVGVAWHGIAFFGVRLLFRTKQVNSTLSFKRKEGRKG